jgi:hypothetical protein
MIRFIASYGYFHRNSLYFGEIGVYFGESTENPGKISIFSGKIMTAVYKIFLIYRRLYLERWFGDVYEFELPTAKADKTAKVSWSSSRYFT